jgi:hypothetical protein
MAGSLQGDNGRRHAHTNFDYRPSPASLGAQAGDAVTSEFFDPEAVVDAMLPLLGLTVTHESRAQTIVHLRIAAELALQLLSVSFDDHEQPAPVFTP